MSCETRKPEVERCSMEEFASPKRGCIREFEFECSVKIWILEWYIDKQNDVPGRHVKRLAVRGRHRCTTRRATYRRTLRWSRRCCRRLYLPALLWLCASCRCCRRGKLTLTSGTQVLMGQRGAAPVGRYCYVLSVTMPPRRAASGQTNGRHST